MMDQKQHDAMMVHLSDYAEQLMEVRRCYLPNNTVCAFNLPSINEGIDYQVTSGSSVGTFDLLLVWGLTGYHCAARIFSDRPHFQMEKIIMLLTKECKVHPKEAS